MITKITLSQSTDLFITFLNLTENTHSDLFVADYLEYFSLDDDTEILIDNISIANYNDQESASSVQNKIIVYYISQRLDLIVLPQSDFLYISEYPEYFADLSEVLPSDKIDEYSPYFLYETVENSFNTKNSSSIPIGIVLPKDSPLFDYYTNPDGDNSEIVISVLNKRAINANTLSMIDFLMNE